MAESRRSPGGENSSADRGGHNRSLCSNLRGGLDHGGVGVPAGWRGIHADQHRRAAGSTYRNRRNR